MVDGEMGGLDSFYLGGFCVLSLDRDCFLSFYVVDVVADEISHFCNKSSLIY